MVVWLFFGLIDSFVEEEVVVISLGVTQVKDSCCFGIFITQNALMKCKMLDR